MMWHDGGWNAGGWILMSVLMLLFWAGVVAVIVVLARGPRHVPPAAHGYGPPAAPPGPGGPDVARRILDERFARGEIDADEYRRRRDTLRETP